MPSGAVKVRVWLASPVTVHPWWSILWCLRQNRAQLDRVVVPPLAQWMMWCTSVYQGGCVAAGFTAALVALLDGGE